MEGKLRNVFKPDVHLVHLVLMLMLVLKLHMQPEHVMLLEPDLCLLHVPTRSTIFRLLVFAQYKVGAFGFEDSLTIIVHVGKNWHIANALC